MRNIKFSLFVLIAFFSCTDDLPKEVHQNDDNKKFTKSVGDGLYDCLGYGYDCLYSNFTDPKYATKAVIDLSKIEMGVGIDQITKVEIKFQPSSIEKSILHGDVYINETFGYNSSDYASEIKTGASADLSLGPIKLFSLTASINTSNKITESSKYACYTLEALKSTRKLTLPNKVPSRLKYFLTDEFLQDLDLMTEAELVETYGTHVLTDILLGGGCSITYTASYNSKSESFKFDFESKAKTLFNEIKANLSYDKSRFSSNENVDIYIKTKGGNNPISYTITQNVNGELDNCSFNYVNWLNSVTQNSEYLIGIGALNTQIYLLSDFIDDPIKKEKVEYAIYTYFTSTDHKAKNKPSLDLTGNVSFFGKYTPAGSFGPGALAIGDYWNSDTKTAGFIDYSSVAGLSYRYCYFEISPATGNFPSGKYVRLKNCYSNLYVTLTNTSEIPSICAQSYMDSDKQLWEICGRTIGNHKVVLKNKESGMYLSPNDLSMIKTITDNWSYEKVYI